MANRRGRGGPKDDEPPKKVEPDHIFKHTKVFDAIAKHLSIKDLLELQMMNKRSANKLIPDVLAKEIKKSNI
tara:strand:+ start:84 stop:299 length:216 start_codon:yes stop_codon:yes gene_type:complete